MLIDWFTVVAQAMNFLVLVWLMQRVLYKPIMQAIAAREALVTAELSNAAVKSTAADLALKDFQRKNESFDQLRASLIAKATDDARTQAAQLLDGVRSEADVLRVKRREGLERDIKELRDDVARHAQQSFFLLARKALRDLANVGLEEQVTARFCERLRALNMQYKVILRTAFKTSGGAVTVRAAFPLPAEALKAIQAAINEVFDREVRIALEVAPQLISGIELTAGGQRVSWSIEDYLASLEQGVAASMSGPAPAASTDPAIATISPAIAPALLPSS